MNKKILIIIQIICYIFTWMQISEKAWGNDLPKIKIHPQFTELSTPVALPPLPKLPELITMQGIAEVKQIRIGIIVDNPKNTQLINIFKNEIHTVLDNDYEIVFPIKGTLIANGQANDINNKANILLNDKNIDIIISLGEFASNYFSTRKSLTKPVISAINFPLEIGYQPSSTNLNYIPSHLSTDNDIAVFHQMIPFKNLTILVDEQVLKSFPQYAKSMQITAKKYGTESRIIPVNNNITYAISRIASNSDAVYITFLPTLTSENFQVLINCLNEKKLPTFSYSGKSDVQKGTLATATPDNNEKIARQTAINIQKIFNGEKPSSIKSNIDFNLKLVINQDTAKKIEYLPDWKIKTEAMIIKTECIPCVKAMSLSDAIKEAITINLDILANSSEVNASKKDINKAYAAYIPHITPVGGFFHVGSSLQSLTTGATTLDLLPANFMLGSVLASQLIYSDKALAGITVYKRIYEANQINNKEIKLDIAVDTANLYIDLLKINNFIKIQRSNLELLNSNLEQAKLKKITGTSDPAEIYRWQTEISAGKKNVLDTENQLDITTISLNRILNHQLSCEINIIDIKLSDPILLTTNEKFIEYIENPYKFKVLQDFIVQKTIAESTDIQKLDKMIQAKEREVIAAKREFWTPDVAAVSQVLGISPNGGLDSNTIWYAGVLAKLPNFDGGANIATYQKLKEELKSLKLKRESSVCKISERSQIALLKIQNSYPSIKLANEASENAHKSLNLVLDKYKKGTIDVYDTLSVQNAALTSDILACNAKFDFISNLIQFQRSIGTVDPVISGKDWKCWFAELETYAQK